MGVNARGRRTVVAVAVFASAATACGDGDAVDEAARSAAIEHLQGRTQVGDRIVWYQSYEEVLPNVSFRVDDEAPQRLSDVVVVGEVVRVEDGRAFDAGVEDGPGGEPAEFDDPRARWRTLHLEVEVDEAMSRAADVGETVTVGLAISGGVDPAVMRRGLEELGTIVLPLTSSSPVFAYGGGDVLSIVEDGAFLGTVAEDETISLPLLDPSEADVLLGSIRTLPDLRAVLAQPDREIPLRLEAGFPVR